jgi:hypothetical protein
LPLSLILLFVFPLSLFFLFHFLSVKEGKSNSNISERGKIK